MVGSRMLSETVEATAIYNLESSLCGCNEHKSAKKNYVAHVLPDFLVHSQIYSFFHLHTLEIKFYF